MTTPFDLRELYGSVYVSEAPDGTLIPWKPLPIGDYIQYESLFSSNFIPHSILEDEIWDKCVTDPILRKYRAVQKAGTVSFVATAIMYHSGPQSIEDLQQSLEQSRSSLARNVLHKVVTIICQGFPSYRPEDVYQLDYSTMMLRLAQAESKLMEIGVLTTPVSFEPNGPAQPQKPEKLMRRLKYDPGKLKEEYEKQKTAPGAPPPSTRKTVITTGEMMEQATFAYTGHEKEDRIINEHKMVKQTAPVYKDIIDKMKKLKPGEKFEMPPYEERLAAAMKRMEQNKKAARKK